MTAVIAIIAVIGVVIIIGLGIFILGASNVQQKNTAVTSWNKWIESERNFTAEESQTMTLYNDHVNTYQSVSGQSSSLDVLKSNFETDRSNFRSWDSALNELNSATSDFSASIASLTGDEKQYADDALTNMRTFQKHRNADGPNGLHLSYR
ncbi:MAG TPA: hypothetical protein VK436_17355 [Methanocella sp.]|nr:hypothetical protein [Methanocella sp.]